MSARDVGLTFAGGGNRAFYQYGLVSQWQDHLLPRVAGVAACSAGACVAAMLFTGRRAQARDVFQARTRGITRNLDWRNLLRGERMAPHGRVFREVMLALGQDGGLERLRALPFPLLVLASAFPRLVPPGLAAAVGIAAYQIEKFVRGGPMHPTFGRRLRFAPAVFDMRECTTPDQLADLVLASSATPPFTPVGRYGGQRLLDGGMVDNVPAFVADALPGVRRNVVLLTRPYPEALLGPRGTRFYVAPLRPVPAERWDYTRPQALEDTVTMGEQEAPAHWNAVARFLDAN